MADFCSASERRVVMTVTGTLTAWQASITCWARGRKRESRSEREREAITYQTSDYGGGDKECDRLRDQRPHGQCRNQRQRSRRYPPRAGNEPRQFELG